MLKKYLRLPLEERVVYLPERRLPLQVMLGSVGHSRQTSADYDWHGLRRGRREFVLFQYTLSGRGRLRVGDDERDVVAGQAMLLRIPADNRYRLPADSDHWDFIYLCLQGSEVMRLWRGVERLHGHLAEFAPDSPAVRVAAEAVGALLAGEVTTEFQSSALAYRLLMALLDGAPAGDGDTPHAAALEAAWRRGQAHFAEPLTVDDLAGEAGLSRYYFTRLFTARYGASPNAWLVDLRVREAARLLRRTDLPIKEIAARCGFGDTGYFGKTFSARMGQTPGGYRRSGL